MKKKMLLLVMLCVAVSLLSGCALSKGTPVAPFKVDIGAMKRGDYEVLDKVSGESETISILFGILQINDGQVKFLGIPFYEPKYARYEKSYLFSDDNALNRAYFNALAKTPDADVVLEKSFNTEWRGIPFLFETEKVRFDGKAVKIKTDKEVRP